MRRVWQSLLHNQKCYAFVNQMFSTLKLCCCPNFTVSVCFLRVKKICKAYLLCSEAKDTVVTILTDFWVSHNYLQSWPQLLLNVCFLKLS